MIFTHLARLVAVITFVFGLLRVLVGLSIATELMGPYEHSLTRYTAASSSGQVIDQGIVTILLAIGLGTLAEVSLSLRKGANR